MSEAGTFRRVKKELRTDLKTMDLLERVEQTELREIEALITACIMSKRYEKEAAAHAEAKGSKEAAKAYRVKEKHTNKIIALLKHFIQKHREGASTLNAMRHDFSKIKQRGLRKERKTIMSTGKDLEKGVNASEQEYLNDEAKREEKND